MKRIETSQIISKFSPGAFAELSHWLIAAYCLVAALSIALAQIFLLTLLAYWLATLIVAKITKHPEEDEEISVSLSYRRLSAPILNWFLICAITAFTGINLARSGPRLLLSCSYLLLPFCIYCSLSWGQKELVVSRVKSHLFALVFSQGVAALHTILSVAAGTELQPRIPGAVTESGQLVLVIPGAVGLLLLTSATDKKSKEPFFTKEAVKSLAFLAVIILFAWQNAIPPIAQLLSTKTSQLLAAAVIVFLVARPLFKAARLFASQICRLLEPEQAQYTQVLWLVGTLLFAALVLNLKRGPWLGSLVVLCIIGLLLSRKIILTTIAFSMVFFAALTPVRNRLFALVNDFVIFGGRKSMWTLGMELVERFPLGLGPDNASYMRTLDPTLPLLHRHMHNNLLNVAVETGFIGLTVYIWWMFAAISLGFLIWRKLRSSVFTLQKEAGVLALTIGTALLGWQVSGFVEYNFGDGEVRLIAFLFMGLLLGLSLLESEEPARENAA